MGLSQFDGRDPDTEGVAGRLSYARSVLSVQILPENERCVRFSPDNPGAPGRLRAGAVAHWEPPYANAVVPRKPPHAGVRRGQMSPLRMLNIPPPFVSNL